MNEVGTLDCAETPDVFLKAAEEFYDQDCVATPCEVADRLVEAHNKSLEPLSQQLLEELWEREERLEEWVMQAELVGHLEMSAFLTQMKDTVSSTILALELVLGVTKNEE